MSPHLKIIIPSYNSLKWLRKTLTSVSSQNYKNYAVCVIDDASTQPGQREYIEAYCKEHNWEFILRSANQGALKNIIDGTQHLKPKDDDVIVTIDGDDWLYSKNVFKKIAEAYQDPAVLMTYGQYITYPRWELGICKPLSIHNFRSPPFITSHLRTYKYKIWKLIKDEDFKDSSGNYFNTAGDLAIMYPLIEMSGGKGCRFIQDILYVYNLDNPLNDEVAHTHAQSETARYIRAKTPYPQLYFDTPSQKKYSIATNAKNYWISFYRKFITPRTYQLAAKKLAKIIYRGTK